MGRVTALKAYKITAHALWKVRGRQKAKGKERADRNIFNRAWRDA
jgi:hypothetical protein